MPWFVCFEFPPSTGFGVFERKGLSTAADSRDEAIRTVRADFEARGFEVSNYPVDAFQYQENDE